MATHPPTDARRAPSPARTGNCPNCLHGRVAPRPDVVCAECQQEPTFAAAVEAFNRRQAVRRQGRAS